MMIKIDLSNIYVLVIVYFNCIGNNYINMFVVVQMATIEFKILYTILDKYVYLKWLKIFVIQFFKHQATHCAKILEYM